MEDNNKDNDDYVMFVFVIHLCLKPVLFCSHLLGGS